MNCTLKPSEHDWVIVPAYNEETVLAAVIEGLLGSFHNVLVVCDGSQDRTSDIAIQSGAHLVRHCVNLGQGAALQTGVDYALSQGAEYLVTFDADGQHQPSDAAGMLSHIKQSSTQVLLGSRNLGSAVAMPTKRKLMLKVATIFTRITTGLELTDTHNGLRALSRDAAKQLQIKQNGMAHASEILHQIAERDIPFEEYPVQVTYSEYSTGKGQSNLSSIRIVLDLITEKIIG